MDTGPVVERVYAKYAGLGWFGKNTCLLNKRLGSWLLLGVLVLTVPLDIDHPMPDHCGTCTRCLDACPWNRIPHFSAEPGLQPRPQHAHPDLEELARLTPAAFRRDMGRRVAVGVRIHLQGAAMKHRAGWLQQCRHGGVHAISPEKPARSGILVFGVLFR